MSQAEQPPTPASGGSPRGDEGGRAPNHAMAIRPMAAVAVALVGALCAAGLTSVFYPVVSVDENVLNALAHGATDAQRTKVFVEIHRDERISTIAALAWSAAVIGGALAIGEGVARRSILAAVLGVFGCAVAAAAFSLPSGWLGVGINQAIAAPGRSLPQWAAQAIQKANELFVRPGAETSPPIWGTIVVQAVVLGMLGCGVGLGLAAAAGRLRGLVTLPSSGLLAGGLAGLIFPMIAAELLPTFQSNHVITGQALTEFVRMAVFAGLIGLIVPTFKFSRG